MTARDAGTAPPAESAGSGPASPIAAPWEAPIVSRRVADDVVDRLVTAFALGLYVPGQQLPPERELAGMLGVSRNSVREALRHLGEDGYLEVRRGRTGGTFVRSDWGPRSAERVRRQLVDHWAEFEAIFDARTLIEPLIARTAAERRTEADLGPIRAALQDYLDAPDHDASRRADARLHLAISQATHNRILVETSVELRTRISLNLGAEPYTDEVRRTAIRQHQDLVAAVAEGRAEDAARIAAVHFTLSEDLMRGLARRAQATGDGT